MSETRVREQESQLKQPQLGIDTVWNVKRQAGEWIIADEMLQHKTALYTAATICLFTDKRLQEGMQAPDGTEHKRGWWGTSDSILLDGEFEFGSFYWTLDRSILNDDTEVKAHDFTILALQPLIDQKVMAELEVNVTSNKAKNVLEIMIDFYSHKTNKKQQQQFNIWWAQTL